MRTRCLSVCWLLYHSRSLCPDSSQTLAETWGAVSVPIPPCRCLQGFASAGGPVGLTTTSQDKGRHNPELKHWFPSFYMPLLPSRGRGHGCHSQLVQMQCDHLKARWVSHNLWDVCRGRRSCAHPTVPSLGLQLSQGRTTNPAWTPS